MLHLVIILVIILVLKIKKLFSFNFKLNKYNTKVHNKMTKTLKNKFKLKIK